MQLLVHIAHAALCTLRIVKIIFSVLLQCHPIPKVYVCVCAQLSVASVALCEPLPVASGPMIHAGFQFPGAETGGPTKNARKATKGKSKAATSVPEKRQPKLTNMDVQTKVFQYQWHVDQASPLTIPATVFYMVSTHNEEFSVH